MYSVFPQVRVHIMHTTIYIRDMYTNNVYSTFPVRRKLTLLSTNTINYTSTKLCTYGLTLCISKNRAGIPRNYPGCTVPFLCTHTLCVYTNTRLHRELGYVQYTLKCMCKHTRCKK